MQTHYTVKCNFDTCTLPLVIRSVADGNVRRNVLNRQKVRQYLANGLKLVNIEVIDSRKLAENENRLHLI